MLIIANPAMQTQPLHILQRLGFEAIGVADPYTAMAELLSAKEEYRGCVLSLQSVYREEISMIGALKRRLPELEIWLSHTDGRQSTLAEAMRLGADGLLGEEGLHRIAMSQVSQEIDAPHAASNMQLNVPPPQAEPIHLPQSPLTYGNEDENSDRADEDDLPVNEPVLTADELRALLQEQPSMPPSGGSEN
jgi:DNA-binding NarL/FixJ family response regulator